MKKFLPTIVRSLIIVFVIGILILIIYPKYKYAEENKYLTKALQNIMLVQDCFMMYGLNQSHPIIGEVTLEDMDYPDEINLGKWDEKLSGYISGNFYYAVPFCTATECSIEAIRWPSASYKLIVVNHEKSCYTQHTELGYHVCKSLKKQGWNYINDKI